MDWLSLLFSIAYIIILFASLWTFSHLYRRRKALASSSLAPYFPPHTQRDVYFSLQALSEDQKVPDSVLRAALLERAVEDIKRIVEIRTKKPALQTLLARGVVGEKIGERLNRAEQEMEVEVKDVVAEANALSGSTGGGAAGQGMWGQSIFQSASEMYNNRGLKERLEKVRRTVEPEKRRWEEQRERSRKELLGLGEDTQEKGDVKVTRSGEAERPLTSSSNAGSVSGAGVAVGAEKTGSDSDGVMVEPPSSHGGDDPVRGDVAGTASNVQNLASGGGGGGTKKKKKGKK